jgi:hypothetical protein
MKTSKLPSSVTMNFGSVEQAEVPQGRSGKHHGVVARILSDLAQLELGRALKIPIAQLGDSKENVRSALNRATRQRNIVVSTASDDDFLYVWKPAGKENGNGKLGK